MSLGGVTMDGPRNDNKKNPFKRVNSVFMNLWNRSNFIVNQKLLTETNPSRLAGDPTQKPGSFNLFYVSWEDLYLCLSNPLPGTRRRLWEAVWDMDFEWWLWSALQMGRGSHSGQAWDLGGIWRSSLVFGLYLVTALKRMSIFLDAAEYIMKTTCTSK